MSLPKTVYVRWDNEDEFFDTGKSMDEVYEESEDDDKGCELGVYELKKKIRVGRKVEVIG